MKHIQELLTSLSPCFLHLNSTDKKEQVHYTKTLFESLLEFLREHSDLLKEQNEYKVNAIRNASRKRYNSCVLRKRFWSRFRWNRLQKRLRRTQELISSSLLSLKQLRDAIHEKKKLNKPIEDDATIQRIIKECQPWLENLAERAEERVPIVEALLSDYKDEVYPNPPQTGRKIIREWSVFEITWHLVVLVDAIADLRAVITGKQLFPSSHSSQSNRSTVAESPLLDLPCVLEDFELGKLKEMMKKDKKSSNVPVITPKKNDDHGVEATLDKVVKCISAILYVCQLPLDISTHHRDFM